MILLLSGGALKQVKITLKVMVRERRNVIHGRKMMVKPLVRFIMK